jgi:Uncharacterized protein predicted to be involved in C-type cytochrome biogenesis
MRLVTTGEVKSDGRTLAAIEIDMPEATKTYWHVPGDTGLPLEVDLGRSQGVSGHQVLWPFPTVERTPDYLDYVYRGHTVIPMLLNVEGDAPQLEASLVMGICSDICIPAQAQFSMPLRDGCSGPRQRPSHPSGARRRADGVARRRARVWRCPVGAGAGCCHDHGRSRGRRDHLADRHVR